MLEKLTSHLGLREKALHAAWVRDEVIAHNMANVDTPGFKKSTVSFEEYLDDALDEKGFKGFTTDSRHIQIGGSNPENVKIRITRDYSYLSTRLDGNNVDIESEMASLAKNYIRYETLVQSINKNYQRLKSVIREGR